MDVRNSRRKFDEIKGELGINLAPIASQSSLNVGGSRRTKDLLRKFLNSLHESIKSSGNKKGEYMLLKGNFARNFRPFDAIMGANLWRRGGDFTWRHRGFNPKMNHPRSRGNPATIEQRS